MGYTYRNKKTKETINTTNKVSGKNWELVEDTDSQMANGEDFEEDIFKEEISEDTAAEEEPKQTEVAEEVPAEKPKASSRGKK